MIKIQNSKPCPEPFDLVQDRLVEGIVLNI